MQRPVALILLIFYLFKLCASQLEETGLCPAPILTIPEEDPLIVTKDVTVTDVLVVTRVNTLTVGGPTYTETTTIMLRNTLTSTEVALTTTTTTTTITKMVTESSVIFRTLLDEMLEIVETSDIEILGPVTVPSYRFSTIVFTSYILTTQTRNFTQILRFTRTTSVISTTSTITRTTNTIVSVLQFASTETDSILVEVIRVTVPSSDGVGDLTITQTVATETDEIKLFGTFTATVTVLTSTLLKFSPTPYTVFASEPTLYLGTPEGTATFYTPVSTLLINS